MAIARNRGEDARNISLNIWLSSAEKTALTARAGDAPVSTWLRSLGLGQPIPAAILARQKRVRNIDAAIAPLVRAVAKIGNNLNQIARQVNMDSIAGRAIDVTEIRLTLAAIRAEVSSIPEEVKRACENLSARSS